MRALVLAGPFARAEGGIAITTANRTSQEPGYELLALFKHKPERRQRALDMMAATWSRLSARTRRDPRARRARPRANTRDLLLVSRRPAPTTRRSPAIPAGELDRALRRCRPARDEAAFVVVRAPGCARARDARGREPTQHAPCERCSARCWPAAMRCCFSWSIRRCAQGARRGAVARLHERRVCAPATPRRSPGAHARTLATEDSRVQHVDREHAPLRSPTWYLDFEAEAGIGSERDLVGTCGHPRPLYAVEADGETRRPAAPRRERTAATCCRRSAERRGTAARASCCAAASRSRSHRTCLACRQQAALLLRVPVTQRLHRVIPRSRAHDALRVGTSTTASTPLAGSTSRRGAVQLSGPPPRRCHTARAPRGAGQVPAASRACLRREGAVRAICRDGRRPRF